MPLDLKCCRYENTERRAELVAKKGIRYMGMGVSGGEEGARNGAPLRYCLKHVVDHSAAWT